MCLEEFRVDGDDDDDAAVGAPFLHTAPCLAPFLDAPLCFLMLAWLLVVVSLLWSKIDSAKVKVLPFVRLVCVFSGAHEASSALAKGSAASEVAVFSRPVSAMCYSPNERKRGEEKKSTKQQFNNFNNSQYQLAEKLLLLPVMQFIWFTKSHFALTFTLCLTFSTNWRKWESRLVALG